jgi:hypothetical protein
MRARIRPAPSDRDWRRRADLNSLAIAAILLLVAVLFAFNQATAGDIQDSRAELVRESCEQQNKQHDNTIRRLDVAIAAIPPGPRKRRAERNRRYTVSLIEALAPERDCDRLVRRVRAD